MRSDNFEIIRSLRADREIIRALLAALVRTPGWPEKKIIFNDLLPLLEAHTYAQEETLLARALGEPSLRHYAMRGLEEHDVIEFLAAKMRRAASEDQWLARLSVFLGFLEDQLNKEEGDFFSAVEKSLSVGERVDLGERYALAREKLKLAPIIEMPLRSSALTSQSGRLGFALAWLLGIPAWLLLIVFLVGGA